ncbi:MAG: hypothetical protein JW861_12885 [Bacteroidales bacterium]|nr:hypothetical protein [Bacteroidales bacterium]
MRKIIVISSWIIVLVGLSVLLGFAEAGQKKAVCKRIEIRVTHPDDSPLFTEDDILSWVVNHFDSLTGRRISEIDQEGVEMMLMDYPYVRKADVYSSLNGCLVIEATQRQPVARFEAGNGNQYYLDDLGRTCPVRPGFPIRVPVITGMVMPPPDSSGVSLRRWEDFVMPSGIDMPLSEQLFNLILYIRNDPFLNAQIEQIHVGKEGDFELVPKLGKHLIVFGKGEDMVQKFDKLKAFYREGIRQAGWDKYSRITLNYKNQVICSKKI